LRERNNIEIVFIILAALLLFLFILSSQFLASAALSTWEHTYGHIAADSIVQAPDGSYVFVARAAYSVTQNGTYADKHNEIVKIDPDGNVVWNTTIGYFPSGDQWIISTEDGGYAAAGSSFNSSAFGWLVKVDAEGEIQWDRNYQQNGLDVFINHAIQTRDNGFAIIGSVSNGKTWFVKIDSMGNMEWNRTYEGSSSRLVAETFDGNYVFAGDNGTQPWLLTSHLVKVDQTGNIQWEKNYENQLGYRPRILISTSDGGCMLAGAGYLNSTSAAAFALKIDTQGNLEWNRTYGENSGFRAVVESREGGYVFAGGIYNSEPRYSARLVKTDSLGDVEWTAIFDGEGNGYVYSLVQTDANDYAFAGATGGVDSNFTSIWVVKVAYQSFPFSTTNLLIIAGSIALLCLAIAVAIRLYRRRKRIS